MQHSIRILILLAFSMPVCVSWAQEGEVRLHLDDADVQQKPAEIISMPQAATLDYSAWESQYPSQVCRDSGTPHKPLIDRAGDINRQNCPPKRYCQADCERAGNPHSVAWWAKCSVNPKHYSAWFVGGDSAWILPHHSRGKKPDEGTWGLDYDGLLKPRRVWLKWSCDREQGGRGAYETDRESGPLAGLIHHE